MKLLWDLFQTFFRIGIVTFGGGYAMLPLIHKELVDKKKWISEEDIIDIFAVGQSLPGAIAINTSIFIGYRKKRYAGAVCSMLGTIMPSFIIITLIALVFDKVEDLPQLQAAFWAIRAAVVALIAAAAVKLGRKAIKDKTGVIIAVIAFIILLLFNINVILMIIAGAATGLTIYFIRSSRKEGRI